MRLHKCTGWFWNRQQYFRNLSYDENKAKTHINMGPRTLTFSAIATLILILKILMDIHPILHPSFASVFCLTSEMLNGLFWQVVVLHQSWSWLNGVVLVDYSVTLVLGNCIVIVKNNSSHVLRTLDHDGWVHLLRVNGHAYHVCSCLRKYTAGTTFVTGRFSWPPSSRQKNILYHRPDMLSIYIVVATSYHNQKQSRYTPWWRLGGEEI
jgi:hypothetical protein